MSEVVYSLCFVTSLLCAVLLTRGFRRSGTKVLLWSALCFCGLALNNLLLFLDWMVPWVDLSLGRAMSNLAAISMLVFGFVWEME